MPHNSHGIPTEPHAFHVEEVAKATKVRLARIAQGEGIRRQRAPANISETMDKLRSAYQMEAHTVYTAMLKNKFG